MTRFANVLEQTRERLQIPEPARTRILLEMASDLEDSYQHYLEQGCDQEEATRRAEEVFGTSDEALQLLERVYRAGVGGVGERFTQQIGTLWAKILIVALLAFEILLAFRIVTDRTFFVYPSPFLWPIAVLALAAFLFTLWKLVQIFSRSGGDGHRADGSECPSSSPVPPWRSPLSVFSFTCSASSDSTRRGRPRPCS